MLRVGAFRFHFYSDEGNEPAHVHVRTPDGECKFWLNPIALASAGGVRPHDVREIERLVYTNELLLLRAYDEFRNRHT